MALLNKLFSSRKKGSKQNCSNDVLFESSSWKQPVFNKDQVRVLLFRECDWRGRKLLFDSASVKKIEPVEPQSSPCRFAQRLRGGSQGSSPSASQQKTEEAKNDGFIEVSHNGTVYQYTRPRSDIKMLGEMVFGSVAMSFKGTTLKIHVLRSPSQLLFTKVFPTPEKKSSDSGESEDALQSSVSELSNSYGTGSESLSSSISSVGHSIPVDVPFWRPRGYHDADDCGLVASSSLRSTCSLNNLINLQLSPDTSAVPTLTHSGSYNSLQRRWLRNRATSMEFGLRKYWDDSVSSEDDRVSSQKRTKLGMSIVITLEENEEQQKQFKTFFFSHITLIEGYLNKLQLVAEKAYFRKKCFLQTVVEGYEAFCQSIYDLYATPRLPDPVWLSMMAYHDQHHIVCLKFVTEFMNLLEQHDTKATNFFVSTVLTAVLTHHLAWVPTVTPPGIPPNHTYYEKHSAKWLDMFAKSHPYNPLWVQLADIYGAVGFPSKVARTIITGKKVDLVRRFLYVLTYFIRCSEVYENLEQRDSKETETFSLSSYSSSEHTASDLSSGTYETLITSDSQDQLQKQKKTIVLVSSGPDKYEEQSSSSSAFETSASVPLKISHSSSCDLCSKPFIFSESPTSQEIGVILRPGRLYCNSCRELYRNISNTSGIRNGCVFETYFSSRAESGIEVDGENCENCSPNRNTGDGLWRVEQVSRITDRDSGIGECVNDDRCSITSTSSKTMVSAEKVKNKLTEQQLLEAKVSFTIGDIPLEDILCPKVRKKSGSRHAKAVPSKHGVDARRLSCDTKILSNGGDVPPAASKLTKRHSLTSNLADSVLHNNGTLSKNTSLVCDSGIQSCEQSSVDMSNLAQGAHSPSKLVNAITMRTPEIRIEHAHSVGRTFEPTLEKVTEGLSFKCEENNKDLTDFIGIPSKKFSVAGNKARRVRCYLEDNEKQTLTKELRNLTSEKDIEQCRNYKQEILNRLIKNGKSDSSLYNNNNSYHLPYTCSNSTFHELLEQSSKEDLPKNCKSDFKIITKHLQHADDCNMHKSKPCWCRSQSEDGLFEKQPKDSKKRFRHNSEASLLQKPAKSWANTFPFAKPVELPLPRSKIKQSVNSTSEYYRGFGWSLVANYSDHYLSDFALQGTRVADFDKKLSVDLSLAVQNSVLDEPVEEAVCIIADIDSWTVKLISNEMCNSERGSCVGVNVGMSQLVANMTETLLHLWKLKMSPEFCLMHLEDRLQEVYFKSRLLAEYLLDKNKCDIQKATSSLGLDPSDLPLLMAVASTHSPPVTCMYGVNYR